MVEYAGADPSAGFPDRHLGQDGGGSGFDINEILRIFYRHRRLIIAVAALIFLGGVLFTLAQTPQFSATSLVLISPTKEHVVAASNDVLQAAAPDSASIDSELEVIKSRKLLGRLADELAKAPLQPTPSLGLRGMVGEVLKPITSLVKLGPSVDASGGMRSGAQQDGIINALNQAITAKRRRLSYVIEVTATDANPSRAAFMANKLAELYMGSQYENRFDAAQRANAWLSERLKDLKGELQTKDAAVAQYKLATGLITTTGDQKAGTFNDLEATQLQTNLVAARADAAEKSVRYRQVQDVMAHGGSADTIAGVANAGRLNDLRKQESEIIQRKADLQTRYGELHPSVKKVQSELNDVHAQIAAETNRIVASLANESAVAQARLAAIAGGSASAKGAVAENNRAMVRLTELQRDADSTREVYESYLKRFQEIADTGNYKTNDVRLVANAPTPKVPSKPNVSQSAITFAILGLLAGLGAAYGVERYQDVLSSAEDFEKRLGVPGLAHIPQLSKAELSKASPADKTPAGYVMQRPMSAFAESLRGLRTALVYSDLDHPTKVVAITSAMPSEGKTTTSLSLARIASQSGQRVLVIDCDLRRRSLGALFGTDPAHGLLQVLAGEVAWRDALYRDTVTDCYVLALTRESFTPRDMFGSEAMKRLIAETKQVFDLVLLDCPPVLAVAETRIVAQHADATVIIAKWGRAPRKSVEAAIRQLREVGVSVTGLVINGLDPRAGAYGYGGYGYGSKAYKGYYAN